MILHPDWKEFLASLNGEQVEYVVIGAHAMAFHGVPRTTGDLDVCIRMSKSNAEKLCRALEHFGFGSLGHTPTDFLKPDQVIQLGVDPNRIDIINSIDGVDFDEVWNDRVRVTWDGIDTNIISRKHLIANKHATGRLRDLDDIERLEKH